MTRRVFSVCAAATAFALVSGAALAEVAELPPEAYDAFLTISLATTARESCKGAEVREAALGTAMHGTIAELAQAGYEPTAAVQHLGSAKGMAELAKRETALRERHDVAAAGADALCDAIRAEISVNPLLAGMVRMP